MKRYFLLGLILLPVGFLTHTILAFSTLDKDKKSQVAAQVKEQRAKDIEVVAAYRKKMADYARKIPEAPQGIERPCPPGVEAPVSYAAADIDFFKQFASGTHAQDQEKYIWYRSEEFNALNENLSMAKTEDWDAADIVKAIRSLEKKPYFLIFYPTGGISWPVANRDAKSFTSGHFDGRQVLVDAATGESLCETALYAANSPTVQFRRVRLARFIKLGSGDFQGRLEEDLSDNFWQAVKQGLGKMKGTR